MTEQTNIIELITSHLQVMSDTDKKIAHTILNEPSQAVNATISELAKASQVSDASVSRFCKNLGLSGFHQLKILLAQAHSQPQLKMSDDIQQNLQTIAANKRAEVENTLADFGSEKVKQILTMIKSARIVIFCAEGDTFPVARDAAYKFNQAGILSIAGDGWDMSTGQLLNMTADDLLIVISNSGEAVSLLQEIKAARKVGMPVIAITNRIDSPIALKADLHLQTAVRQQIFQSEYYFSRVAAMTAIEALFLLLLAQEPQRLDHIKQHEDLISDQKI
ncbi:MurR/RpiR family transcriptional regulator [Lactobacillus corticis]|uniref:RpiR family transcriptional regulator n=1 Tax=Lactobacillus corticis TaxID=2201249 RepID=A0A916QGF7_9LACO|nr:MurR/RpiR family transcriptional regulator [Lactobacillus corticis]GFZ26846.1 RpiR family transcriptional regulator [Lactobacillus corticis]